MENAEEDDRQKNSDSRFGLSCRWNEESNDSFDGSGPGPEKNVRLRRLAD